jgi:alkylation response protein AidB-like acyl-CoA dehydrogenase
MMFALVRTEPDARKHEGISYLVFPMSTPGIEVRPLHTLTGNAEFNEVFFSNVRVPKASLVGRAARAGRSATPRCVTSGTCSAARPDRVDVRVAGRADAGRDDQRRARDRSPLRDRLVRLRRACSR